MSDHLHYHNLQVRSTLFIRILNITYTIYHDKMLLLTWFDIILFYCFDINFFWYLIFTWRYHRLIHSIQKWRIRHDHGSVIIHMMKYEWWYHFKMYLFWSLKSAICHIIWQNATSYINDSKSISIYIHRVIRRVVDHLQVDPPRKQKYSSFKYWILDYSFEDSG